MHENGIFVALWVRLLEFKNIKVECFLALLHIYVRLMSVSARILFFVLRLILKLDDFYFQPIMPFIVDLHGANVPNRGSTDCQMVSARSLDSVVTNRFRLVMKLLYKNKISYEILTYLFGSREFFVRFISKTQLVMFRIFTSAKKIMISVNGNESEATFGFVIFDTLPKILSVDNQQEAEQVRKMMAMLDAAD